MNNKKEDIQKIIRLIYLSAFLKDEKPLSLLCLAPPEQSKTHFLLENTTKYSHHSTDLSFQGLIKILKENAKLKHIVIPDFLKITGKKQSTKENFITFLNGFLEEGIFEINLGNHEKIDFKGRNGALITATTNHSFNQNKKHWSGMGFTSRFIVMSWCYSQKTLKEILLKINKEESSKKQKSKIISCKVTKVFSDSKINKLLNPLSEFSPRKLKNLQVLAKCLALEDGRKRVLKKDIQEIKRLSYLLNFRFTEI